MICWDRSGEASGVNWGVALTSQSGDVRYKLLKKGCLRMFKGASNAAFGALSGDRQALGGNRKLLGKSARRGKQAGNTKAGQVASK